MNRKKYEQTRSGVAAYIAVVMAFSIIRHSYEVAMIGVALGILVIVTANRRLDEVIRDERNAVIQQKASAMTLSIVTIGLVLVGIAVEELSYRGYESMRGYGSFMTYIAMGIMVLNSLFTWHYGRQLGD